MKILITGATGLIGSELCKFLSNHHELTVLTRHSEKAYQKIGHHINAVQTLDNINFNKIDAVINLAGEPIADKRWSAEQKKRITQSRIDLTNAISDKIIAATTPPQTFISGSAIGYYGRQTSPVTEKKHACFDEFSHQLCKEWETAAIRAQSVSTRVVLLRTGIVLAKNGGALSKMLLPVKLGLGGPLGSGEQMMSWIHIDDMVSIILHALEHKSVSGPVNATAPHPVSNNEFSKILADTLSRPNFFRMPEKMVKLMFGEMSELFLFGQAVIPEKILADGFKFHYPKLDKALAQLLEPAPETV